MSVSLSSLSGEVPSGGPSILDTNQIWKEISDTLSIKKADNEIHGHARVLLQEKELLRSSIQMSELLENGMECEMPLMNLKKID
ncbi:MAG TPA: hypothetical protein VFZ52_07285 [Chryseolinea sp.]